MPHLHLSLQSGSGLVLKRMRRRHSPAGPLAAIARARRLRPGVAIGADLIAGFPTETDALAAETERFVAEAAIPYLHVFPYSERPGTPAARMPAVPVPVRRERAARLRAIAAGMPRPIPRRPARPHRHGAGGARRAGPHRAFQPRPARRRRGALAAGARRRGRRAGLEAEAA